MTRRQSKGRWDRLETVQQTQGGRILGVWTLSLGRTLDMEKVARGDIIDWQCLYDI